MELNRISPISRTEVNLFILGIIWVENYTIILVYQITIANGLKTKLHLFELNKLFFGLFKKIFIFG
jgi:hypothetical protein